MTSLHALYVQGLQACHNGRYRKAAKTVRRSEQPVQFDRFEDLDPMKSESQVEIANGWPFRKPFVLLVTYEVGGKAAGSTA